MKNFTVQVMQEMNMKWRKDGEKKTFMERLVNLAAERVRRGLMPNLRKKLKRDDDSSKSHKQKRLKLLSNSNFDPTIHVKEDLSSAANTMDGMTVTTQEDRSVSSVTDRDQEDSVVLMIEKYYRDNNTRLLPIEIFEACRKSKPGYIELSKESNLPHTEMCESIHPSKEQEDTDKKVTFLTEDAEVKKRTTDDKMVNVNVDNLPNTLMAPGTGDIIQKMPPLQVLNEVGEQSDEELIEPFHKCEEGGCEFKLEINNNPHESTIEKDFGKGMKCVGVECGKTLLECFKTKNINGAYVCNKCRTGSCKHMYCCGCFANTEYAKTKERTRRQRAV